MLARTCAYARACVSVYVCAANVSLMTQVDLKLASRMLGATSAFHVWHCVPLPSATSASPTATATTTTSNTATSTSTRTSTSTSITATAGTSITDQPSDAPSDLSLPTPGADDQLNATFDAIFNGGADELSLLIGMDWSF
jgi:beta-lactamase regulating signal transducer with metallopeptidase domain